MQKLLAILTLALAASGQAQANYGIGVTNLLGPLTFEQVRFGAPAGPSGGGYITTRPVYTGVASADQCAGNSVCGESIVFDTKFGGPMIVTATDSAGNLSLAVQDLSVNYAGLGAKPADAAAPSAGTSINAGEMVTMSFARQVKVVGFTFFDRNQSNGGLAEGDLLGNTDRFGMSIDGGPAHMLTFNGNFPWYGAPSTYIGHSFTFSMVDADYYIYAIKIAEVPEPATYAMLFAGLVAIGLLVRGRRRDR